MSAKTALDGRPDFVLAGQRRRLSPHELWTRQVDHFPFNNVLAAPMLSYLS